MAPDVTLSLLCAVAGGAWHGSCKRQSYAEGSLSVSTLVIMVFLERSSQQVSMASLTLNFKSIQKNYFKLFFIKKFISIYTKGEIISILHSYLNLGVHLLESVILSRVSTASEQKCFGWVILILCWHNFLIFS